MVQVHEAGAIARKFFTPDNAKSYDSVVRFATFGRDRVWKEAVLRAIDRAESVLELASGTGILTSMLVDSGKSVVGLDLTFGYLVMLKMKSNILVAQATAETLPYRAARFDAVVSSYLAKYVDPRNLANECSRVLRPGGKAVFHDFTYPTDRLVRGLWAVHFLMLRLCGFLVPEWSTVFSQLKNVIADSEWEGRFVAALSEAGFTRISLKYYTAGTTAIIVAEKP